MVMHLMVDRMVGMIAKLCLKPVMDGLHQENGEINCR